MQRKNDKEVLSQQELNMLLYTAELLGWAYLKIEI
jgi:hypothetical protein